VLLPEQMPVGLAEAVAVGNGFTVTAVQTCVPVKQALEGVTQTFPELVPKVTVMVLVPCPLVTVAPLGTVQL
jgi:hypothetical protein